MAEKDNQVTVFDPLRKTEVALTPEEEVRQWFIGELAGVFGVPARLMNSEVALTFGKKRYRADIVVFDRAGKPLAVVECKRSGVAITADVARQALRYHSVLNVDYIFLTNGNNTYLYARKDGDSFAPLDHIPSYQEMLLCRQK